MAKFREAFTFISKDLMQYFPGHMAKGMTKMQSKLECVDCVIEVHDARIPFSGRNKNFNTAIYLRPHMLILNKEDLADLSESEQVRKKLRGSGVTKVLYTNCKENANQTVKTKIIPEVLKLVSGQSRYHRTHAEDYNLLVIGVPNVGKSSLINALRRVHLKRGKATHVGGVPGITRSVLEKIKISENPKIYVLDSPGILDPTIEDVDIGMKLALCATLQDHLLGEDTIADYMLYWLNKHQLFTYVEYFSLPGPTDNILTLLAHVAKQRNMVKKQRSTAGGYTYLPDFNLAAKIVLRAFREGHLGKVNLDKDQLLQDTAPR